MGDRSPLTSELERLAEDVVYEVAMLRWAVHGLAADEGDARLRNALVEVARLHQRNLTHFFLGVGDGDDLSVTHFVPSWDPRATVERATAHEELRRGLRSINKRLAHLTAYRQRVAKGDDELPLGEAWHHVETLWIDFVNLLAPDRRAWFQ